MIHARVTPLRGAAAAHDTLIRGATFLAALAERPILATRWPAGLPGPDGLPARRRARFVANCLRELDRFLHGLLDELGASAGHVVREDQRNTANKLRDFGVHPAAVGADQRRLRALGRSSACLIHCDGWVRRPDRDGGAIMTAGWSESDGPALRRYALGARLTPGTADIIDICRFYDDLGERLIVMPPAAPREPC